MFSEKSNNKRKFVGILEKMHILQTKYKSLLHDYICIHLCVHQYIYTATHTHMLLLNLASGTPEFRPQNKSISDILNYLNY